MAATTPTRSPTSAATAAAGRKPTTTPRPSRRWPGRGSPSGTGRRSGAGAPGQQVEEATVGHLSRTSSAKRRPGALGLTVVVALGTLLLAACGNAGTTPAATAGQGSGQSTTTAPTTAPTGAPTSAATTTPVSTPKPPAAAT